MREGFLNTHCEECPTDGWQLTRRPLASDVAHALAAATLPCTPGILTRIVHAVWLELSPPERAMYCALSPSSHAHFFTDDDATRWYCGATRGTRGWFAFQSRMVAGVSLFMQHSHADMRLLRRTRKAVWDGIHQDCHQGFETLPVHFVPTRVGTIAKRRNHSDGLGWGRRRFWGAFWISRLITVGSECQGDNVDDRTVL